MRTIKRPPTISLAQTAAVIGMSVSTARQLADTGALPCIQISRIRTFLVADVERFLQSRYKGGTVTIDPVTLEVAYH